MGGCCAMHAVRHPSEGGGMTNSELRYSLEEVRHNVREVQPGATEE